MNAMLLLKATILLFATLAAARVLRRAPAGARHHFWTGAFAGLLVLPVVAAIVPIVHVPVPQSWTTATTSRDATPSVSAVERSGSRPSLQHMTTVVAPRSDAGGQADPGGSFVIRTGDALLVTWLTGVLGAVGALMVSLLRVGRLARSAETENDPDWNRAAQDLSGRLGLRRSPRLLSSPAVTTPMAAGVFRPTVFLPAAAASWTSEQRDIVLAHEIAHLVARDPLRHLLTRLAMAGYWFHPAAWLAAREAAIAREQACDEAVLALGTKPSSYARVLLEFAGAASAAPQLSAALPIVHPSVLEKRLMAILDGDHRPTPRRVLLVPAAGVALLTLTVAAAHPRVGASPRPLSNGAAALSAIQTPSLTPVSPVRTALTRLAGAAGTIEPVAPPQDAAAASGCGWIRGRSFNGNTTVDDSGGRVIREQVGWSGRDRVIQTSFNDLRMCMVAEGLGEFSENERPSQWMDRAPRIVMETHRSGRVHQLEVVNSGNRHTTWRIGGAERPFDQAGQQWRTQLLAVLDATWELSMLRGQVSSLRGDISSIEGERSSLRGEISSLQGEVSSMRGHASSILGEESSLRGEISSIRGHVSSLRGEISSQRGAISSLNGHRYSDRDDRLHVDALVAKHEKEIAALERDIRDYNEEARVAAVEKQVSELNAAKKVAQIEAEIKAFDLDRKIAEIERQIAKLDVEGQAGAIEGKIRGLDADRRGRQLEDRRATDLKRLDAAISATK